MGNFGVGWIGCWKMIFGVVLFLFAYRHIFLSG